MFAGKWWYCIADYIPMAGTVGFTPDLPDGVPFVLLASPCDEPRWGIFGCGEDVSSSGRVQMVSAEIAAIIESARSYPPALGLARDEMEEIPGGAQRDRRAFAELYSQSVARHFSLQGAAPYVLAEAVGDEPGYLSHGQKYWVVRYLRGANEVRWVSEDFQIYRNPVSDFRLSAEQLASLLLPFKGAV